MNTPPINPGDAGSFRPVALLAGLTLGGWIAGALWPGLLAGVGILHHPTSYLDSYALLAALDAVRAGVDPHGTNAFDIFGRGHVYSDWWLALRWLGLTREHNFAVGTTCVGLFALTAWMTTRPRRLGEAWWLAALLLSPPVLLAVMRANNDLVIFVLLAGCGLAATAAGWWRPLLAVGCLALATGLKYFPVSGALAFLWIRPVRRVPSMLLGALVAALLALASVWDEVDRGRFTVPSTVHTMGAPLWGRELGWKDADSALPGLLLLIAAAAALALGRFTVGLAGRGEPRERLRAALGALMVLTCFVAGVNYAYRWIFVIWPALWLWRQAADATLPGRERWVARTACALVLLCLWLDGILCFALNEFVPIMTKARLDEVQSTWRLWTQPLHWCLMLLLAGWLLEGVLATVREWWSARHAGPASAGPRA